MLEADDLMILKWSQLVDFLQPGRKAVKPDEMASTFSCVEEVGVNSTLVLFIVVEHILYIIIYEQVLVILEFKYN